MNYEHLTDEEIVLHIRAGGVEAFGELVERHSSTVLRVAFMITRRPQEAEDIVQDAFFQAFKSLESFSADKAQFKTWLLTIARNRSINVFASIKRKATMLFSELDGKDDDSAGAAENLFGCEAPDAEAMLGIKQEHARVEAALGKLPERQRTALMLKARENLSYEAVAVVMNTSASSVESLIFRARKKLTELLTD